MLFRSCSPGLPLAPIRREFWLCRVYSSPHLRERILPSGTFEIVFNLKEDAMRTYKASDADAYAIFSGAIVSGPYADFSVTDLAEETAVMGVHLKPEVRFRLSDSL
jgi:hypothetical protein